MTKHTRITICSNTNLNHQMGIARQLEETILVSRAYFLLSTKEQRIRSAKNLEEIPAHLGAQRKLTKVVFILRITGDFATGDVLEVKQVLIRCYLCFYL